MVVHVAAPVGARREEIGEFHTREAAAVAPRRRRRVRNHRSSFAHSHPRLLCMKQGQRWN